MIELADHLCDERNRHLYGKVLDAIAVDARSQIIPAEQQVLNLANELYRAR